MLKIINEKTKSMFQPSVMQDYANPPWYKGRVEIFTTKGPVLSKYKVKVKNNFIYELELTTRKRNEIIASFNEDGWITKPAPTDKVTDYTLAYIYDKYGAPIFYKTK